MALRFRKTFKVAPGVKLNLTHRGLSGRVGAKGLSYSIGGAKPRKRRSAKNEGGSVFGGIIVLLVIGLVAWALWS